MTARPRVATVLTAREWETNLVNAARATSAIRLVARAYEPTDLTPEVDVVVVGAETSWVTPAFIKTWRRRGVRILGLHPPGDRPALRMLQAADADEIRPDTTSSFDLIHLARILGLHRPRPENSGRVIAVTGPHGAPGRTEVAVTLAQELAGVSSTLLLDLDVDAPSVSMRLGLLPEPSIEEAQDKVRAHGEIPDSVVHRAGALDVVIGDLGGHSLARSMSNDVVRAAARRADFVVVDTPAWRGGDPVIEAADAAVLVCEASPVGLVRGAKVALRWAGPHPMLVLNRVPNPGDDAIAAARRAIGLEPSAVIPELPAVRTAAVSALPPARTLRTALQHVTLALAARG